MRFSTKFVSLTTQLVQICIVWSWPKNTDITSKFIFVELCNETAINVCNPLNKECVISVVVFKANSCTVDTATLFQFQMKLTVAMKVVHEKQKSCFKILWNLEYSVLILIWTSYQAAMSWGLTALDLAKSMIFSKKKCLLSVYKNMNVNSPKCILYFNSNHIQYGNRPFHIITKGKEIWCDSWECKESLSNHSKCIEGVQISITTVTRSARNQ